MSQACPFCDSALGGETCPACGRNRRQARAPCGDCGRLTPLGEATCAHCGAVQYRGQAGRIVAIIAMFIIAGAASLALRLGLG